MVFKICLGTLLSLFLVVKQNKGHVLCLFRDKLLLQTQYQRHAGGIVIIIIRILFSTEHQKIQSVIQRQKAQHHFLSCQRIKGIYQKYRSQRQRQHQCHRCKLIKIKHCLIPRNHNIWKQGMHRRIIMSRANHLCRFRVSNDNIFVLAVFCGFQLCILNGFQYIIPKRLLFLLCSPDWISLIYIV